MDGQWSSDSACVADLILPCVAAMSDAEFAGLISYLGQGGRLLVTGAMGNYTEDGTERPVSLLKELRKRKENTETQFQHRSSSEIEKAGSGKYEIGKTYTEPSARALAVKTCLGVLGALLPHRTLWSSSSASGWSFHLYRQADTFILHFLNLSGTMLINGREVPDDQSLRFDVPTSGIIECRIHLAGEAPRRARLYSPDGAEGQMVEVAPDGEYTRLRIPVRNACHYGIVAIETED